MHTGKRLFSAVLPVILLFMLAGCGQKAAEIERQKDIARLVTEEAWNKGNFEVLDEHYAQEFVRLQAPFPDIQGLDAYKKYIQDNRETYPDLRIVIKDIIVEGNKVVMRGTYQGTQEGISPTLGISTGREVNFKWCTISRKVKGMTVEEICYVDWLGFMQQVGYTMLPPITEATFARVTVTRMKPETLGDAVKLYRESVVPDAKSQKGYRATMLLSDFETGNGYSIAIWDSEEDAVANEQSGYYQEQVDKFKDIFSAQPVKEGYAVTVQD